MLGRLQGLQPYVLGILRIVTGVLYLQHGTSKLLGVPHTARPETIAVFSLLGVAGLLESIGGTLVALGLFTRVAAFLLSGEMAVAYFMAHQPRGLFPLLNGGEDAILFCFVFFYFVFAGGGAFSLGTLLTQRPPSRAQFATGD
jgi:putative oxidoreductase